MNSDIGVLWNKIAMGVAIGLMFLLGIAILSLTFATIPDANKTILQVIIVALTTNLTTIVGALFGMSIANKAKDQSIVALTEHIARLTPANDPKAIPIAPGEVKVIKGEEVAA